MASSLFNGEVLTNITFNVCKRPVVLYADLVCYSFVLHADQVEAAPISMTWLDNTAGWQYWCEFRGAVDKAAHRLEALGSYAL